MSESMPGRPSARAAVLEPKVLLDGIAMGESPRWHNGWLWFADWASHEIVAVEVVSAQRAVASKIDSMPFSIDWLPDDSLMVLVGRDAKLLVETAGGRFKTQADLSSISTKPWNEIVVDGRGNSYVNNIGFDYPGGDFEPGVIALVKPDGTTRVVAEGLAFPNGMVVTPDNRELIVAESYGSVLTAYQIADDGSLDNRRVWAKTGDHHPDGICLDTEGAVWYADVGSSRCVRIAQDGKVLSQVALDRGCFACMLGGEDRQTLYMLAADWSDPQALMSGDTRTGQLLTVPAPAPGAGWP